MVSAAKLLWFYKKYTHIIRGGLMFALAQLAAGNLDQMALWDKRRWALAIGAALIASMRAGKFDDPPPDPKP